MANTQKTQLAKIANAWRHSLQWSEDSFGDPPLVNKIRSAKSRSNEAKRTGT